LHLYTDEYTKILKQKQKAFVDQKRPNMRQSRRIQGVVDKLDSYSHAREALEAMQILEVDIGGMKRPRKGKNNQSIRTQKEAI
jgi:hypothetical protein